MRILKLIFGLAAWLCVIHLSAANRYWVGGAGANWNTTASWSTASGGASGASVPGSADVAIFDGGANTNCTINAAVNVAGLQMNSGYSSTISQNANTITVGASGWTVSSGTFTGSSSSITLSGTLTLSGGTFTSTSGTLTTSANITLNAGGTFSNNSGTVTIALNGTMTISGSPTFYNLTFSPSGATGLTATISNSPTVTHLLQLIGSKTITLNTGTLNVTGDIQVTNTIAGCGGTATVAINGTGTQTLTGSGTANTGALPYVSISKTSGTLNLSSIITCNGDWSYTQGTVSPGTSGLICVGTFNIDCQGTSTTMPLYNFAVYTGTRTLTGNMDVDNNLNIQSGATLSGSSYSMNVGGIWNDAGTWTAGTSTVIFDGAVYKAASKSGGTETFYNATINRSGGTVALGGVVQVNNVLTLTTGKIKTTSSNYLSLIAGASVSGGSNTSYVCGPVRKTGTLHSHFRPATALLFVLLPSLAITAPSVSTDAFQAEYKAAARAYGSTLGSGLASLSGCEYWTLERKAGTSTPTPTLNWNSNCDNSAYSEMRVAGWNGSQWSDMGQTSLTITNPTGSVKATSSASFTANPMPLTIAYTPVSKSYATLRKKMDGGYYNTDGNVLYFCFEEQYKDIDGKLTYRVIDKSNATVTLVASAANYNAPVAYGNNKYKIDLYDGSNTVLASGMYLLEVTNEKNEKFLLRFNKN